METIKFRVVLKQPEKQVVEGEQRVPVGLTREEQRVLVAEVLARDGYEVSSVLWP